MAAPAALAAEDQADASAFANFDRYEEEERGGTGAAIHEDLALEIPPEVQEFLLFFEASVNNQDVDAITSCYDSQWKKHTDRLFKDSKWPNPAFVSQLVEDDSLFVTLYRELYFRHIYMNLTPTVEDRFDSYDNYIDLFNYMIEAEKPVFLKLPNKWIWDIIDEFIYQFQDFTLWKAKVEGKTEGEKQQLQDNPQMWNVHIVLNVLHSLIVKSNINAQLEVYQRGEDPLEVAGEFGSQMLYKMMGYFSLVGLLRLQCLLGDYRQALQVMANIQLDKKDLYSLVPACQITIYHYVGFCYLMLRRYQDAIRSFETILYYLQRTHSYHSKSSQYDIISRKRDHIFGLLALTYALCPQRLDDGVQREMMEREGDNIRKVQAGDDEALTKLFKKGCPRYLSPVPVDYSNPPEGDLVQQTYEHQIQLFKNDVKQQCLLFTIRSYLQLYKSMSIAKLASFLDMSEDELRIQLHSYKHKMGQLTWTSGSPLEGERQCADSLDFFIDKDMIHIANVTVAKNYGAHFLRSSLKLISTTQQRSK
jgi:translation initiation factor 3 subunit L